MTLRRAIAILALAAALAGLSAAPSLASVRVVHASGGKGSVAVFRLKGVAATRIERGWIAPRGLSTAKAPRGKSATAGRRGFQLALRRRVEQRRLRAGARRGVLRIRVASSVAPAEQPGDSEPALIVQLASPASEPTAAPTGNRSGSAPKRGPGRTAEPKPAPEPAPAPEPTTEPAPEPAPAPEPTPTVPAGDCQTATLRTAETFAAGSWPTGCWRPYADSSPFNQTIPPNPRLVSNSAAIVETLTGWGKPADLRAGIADTSSDWDHPIYFSQPSDPIFTVHCTESWGRCEIEGEQIRIPQAARAAGGGDAHMTVIDQASGWEYDLYKYCYEGCSSSSVRTLPSGGGKISIRWGGKTALGGDGLGSDATAALFGLAAGVIRPEEILRGRIDHALFMVVRCDSGNAVWPAAGLGAACASGRSNAPSEGTRFQLDMSVDEIEKLTVPGWKKTILRAMSEYGMYVGDTSGSTPWNIQFASGSTYTSFGSEDQLVHVAKTLGVRASSDGRYYFDIAGGVDWKSRLRVIDPCVARNSC